MGRRCWSLLGVGIAVFAAKWARAGDPPARDAAEWWAGRPLREAVCAHATNTRSRFEAALRAKVNWLEGDVRASLEHPDRLEMRHDAIFESGEHLSLREWLIQIRALNKGAKLDIKEGAIVSQVVATLVELQMPEERLMLNLQDKEMEVWGGELRRRFPNAYLAINTPYRFAGKRNDKNPLEPWQEQRMLELASRFGGPVTFTIRHDQVSATVLQHMRAYGPVSVWGAAKDPERRSGYLRALGVDGMIDLVASKRAGPLRVVPLFFNTVRTWWEKQPLRRHEP